MENTLIPKLEELKEEYTYYIGDSLGEFEMVSGLDVILPGDYAYA